MTHEDQWMETLRVRLLRGMREYMARVVVPYDESHVQECDGILVEHARALAMAAGERDARRIVRATVANLNALNARCRGMLIETDQREDIGEYIIRAGFRRGFNGEGEDVTEEWREW